MSLVDLLQPLLHDVGIDLRRGIIGMPQHQLHGAQIGATFQEMRGKTVPQHVRCKRRAQPSLAPVGREYLPHAHAAERSAAAINEQRGGQGLLALANQLGASIAQKALDQRESFLTDRDNALLVALADTTHAANGSVEIHDAKRDEFGNAKAGGIKNVEHGMVAQAQRRLVVGLCQKAFDFFEAKIARERTANLRRFQVHGRIRGDEFLKLGEAEEIAQRYEMTRYGAAFELLAIEAGQEFD